MAVRLLLMEVGLVTTAAEVTEEEATEILPDQEANLPGGKLIFKQQQLSWASSQLDAVREVHCQIRRQLQNFTLAPPRHQRFSISFLYSVGTLDFLSRSTCTPQKVVTPWWYHRRPLTQRLSRTWSFSNP